MPTFSYQAITDNGNNITGTIEADSPEAAAQLLAERGYIPARVTATGRGGSKALAGLADRLAPVKAPDLILFTKQFRTMIRAGVSIMALLQIMENQTDIPQLKKAVGVMAENIKGGATLYDAFRKHPRIFSPLYCSMIRAGESSGALPEVLERLTYIIEHEHKVKADIKAALQYPLIVLCALGVAFFVLLTFVIPKFVAIFLKAGLTLPLPTKICLVLYQILAGYWPLLIGGTVLVPAGLLYYFKTEPGRYVLSTLLLRLPLLGPLLIKAAMSRFAGIFAILQASGVGVLESMDILTETIGNVAIAREFQQVRERLEGGRGIAGPLKSARYFTPMVINMVAIGEESGNLEEMLREVAIHYDAELDYNLKKLADAIGPLLTVGLAVVVGFFALAIFLPMWDLTKMVH